MFNGDKVRLYKARLLGYKQDRRPGEILEISNGEIIVALTGGALGFGKVRDSRGEKMNADEFAKKMDLRAGMRFGS
jgi:methionyl-tRNA formyltransferase